MKRYELVITIDTNDADYLTEVTLLSEQEYKDFDKFITLLSVIKENNGEFVYNYENNYRKNDKNIAYYDVIDEYEINDQNTYPIFEDFFEFLPNFDHGLHTIVKCNLREIDIISEIDFV